MNKKKIFIILFCFAITLILFSFLPNFTNLSKSSQLPSSPSPRPHNPFPTRNSQPTLTPFSLIAVGDIMLGRFVNVKMIEHQDWRYPFLKTAPFLASADLTFGNLEAPFVENCPTTATGMIFCARKEAIEGLKFTGFDVLSIANNHILNQRQKGREETINLLKQNGISPSFDSLTMKKLPDEIIGFLSFDLTVNNDPKPVLGVVKESSSKVDILIISLHWGAEYEKEPRPWQKNLAHQIIDAGAKVIIGHHPHVTQPTEEYHNGLIFYSLGNFVFDQDWSEETKKGKIAKIIFKGKEIESFEEISLYIEDNSQPQIR
ncbi:MAG: CapA family protein [Patescibacteria group bacterium]|nr:CapA family protein [Patescibacteria group bacterium]